MKGNNHVELMIAVDINEAQGDRDQVGIRAVELGADVDAGVAGVTAWQLDDLNPPVEIDGQKMTRHTRCFVMPNIGIDLKRAWPSKPQIIQRGREPGGHDA